jgi:hypothetical protein
VRAVLVLVGLLLAGCGAEVASEGGLGGVPRALLLQARPIGSGPAFHPGVRGPVLGPCGRGLGPRYGVHLEVFAENRVVIVPAGIGTRAPLTFSSGRIASARCYGGLVTLEPTGVVLVRAGGRFTVSDLLRSWGRPLSAGRLLSFTGRVSAFVGGRRWRGPAGLIPLARHAQVVLEVGPYVPPHSSYTFPPGS